MPGSQVGFQEVLTNGVVRGARGVQPISPGQAYTESIWVSGRH